MNDYEKQYTDYKAKLLKDRYFLSKFKEKYENASRSEKDYIDRSGVLTKVGILSAVCGASLSMFFFLESGSGAIGTVVYRIITFLVCVASVLLAVHIGSKFKEASGKSNFFSFQYRQHIESRVYEDKQREMHALMEDIDKRLLSIRWCAEKIKKEGHRKNANSEKANQQDLLYFIETMDDVSERYHIISNYDRIAKQLADDYNFSVEVNRNLK